MLSITAAVTILQRTTAITSILVLTLMIFWSRNLQQVESYGHFVLPSRQKHARLESSTLLPMLDSCCEWHEKYSEGQDVKPIRNESCHNIHIFYFVAPPKRWLGIWRGEEKWGAIHREGTHRRLFSSVGSAPDCRAEGHGFDSRYAENSFSEYFALRIIYYEFAKFYGIPLTAWDPAWN